MSGILNLPFTIVYGLYMNNNIGQPSDAKACFVLDGVDHPAHYNTTQDYAELSSMSSVTNVTD